MGRGDGVRGLKQLQYACPWVTDCCCCCQWLLLKDRPTKSSLTHLGAARTAAGGRAHRRWRRAALGRRHKAAKQRGRKALQAPRVAGLPRREDNGPGGQKGKRGAGSAGWADRLALCLFQLTQLELQSQQLCRTAQTNKHPPKPPNPNHPPTCQDRQSRSRGTLACGS